MSRPSSLNDLSLLLVSERDDAQGGLFREYFHTFPNVSVTKSPFDELEVIDCLVIPCPSSYCERGNDITDYYMSRLPERTRDKIMKHIQLELFGEQQPGTAFIVKNTGKSEKYKYVAFLCLTRVAETNVPMEFAYTAMRGLILALLEFNRTETSPIEVVAIPGFTLNSSTPEQKRMITRHMSLAYRNMFYPMKHLPSPEEAKILTAQLLEKTAESPGERRNRTREMLINGELVKRGLYVEDELRFLIEMVEHEGELRKLAAKALAYFVHSPPSEFTLSIEAIGSAISKSKTGLQYLLDEAEAGSFTLFKEIKPSEIEFGEEIGSGTEACVLKAKWESRPIAIKKFRGIPSTTQFQRELSIMSLVQHPNLLRCYGGYSDTKKDEYYLVMDLMDTDVHAALQQVASSGPAPGNASPPPMLARSDPRSSSPLRNSSPAITANAQPGFKRTWEIRYPQMLKIALHTARGMEYLHECNLIHRDLKSVNLLIDEHYNAKVCDFGLSRIIAPKNQNMTGNVGTVSWIAPEVFEKQPYDAKADVYSFGIVMWELYTKQVPFQDLNTFEIPMAVIKGERPPIPKECPKEYAKLMQSCWHKKPAKRPTFQKIVKSLLKLTKDNGLPEAPGSPAPLLARAAGGFSQSAIVLRTRESSLYNSTGSLEESATTSSSRSEEDGPDKKVGSGKVPPSLASFPRRRTASSATIGPDTKSSSSPNIHSKRGSTIRASGDFKMVAELPEEGVQHS